MSTRADRLFATGLLLLVLFAITPGTYAASDDRFFGNYCGTYAESYRVPACFPFPPFCTLVTRTFSFSVNLRADYAETRRGNGLVTGQGTASGEGHHIRFLFSGLVTARGRLEGTGTAPGWDPVSGRAALGDGGNKLSVIGMDRTVVVRKDRCGNTAPTATITAPTGSEFPWAESIHFEGRAGDAEDAGFPARHLVWASNRDGHLGDGLSIRRNFLSPGRHLITFTVTDSGGRQTTATKEITVRNNPPRVRILCPAGGARFTAKQEIPFSAWATDVERGYLSGARLTWSDGDGRVLGTGDQIRARLTAGRHTVTLTADDGETVSRATVDVTVAPAGANDPPTPSIVTPRHFDAVGDADHVVFSAVAGDPEGQAVTITWKVLRQGASDAEAMTFTGNGISRGPFPASADRDTRYTITVTADDGTNTPVTSCPTTLYVIFGGLI